MPIPAILGTLALNALMSRLGAGAQYGRQKQLLAALNKLFSVQGLSNDTNALYGQFEASPMRTAMRSQAAGQSNQIANQLQRSFAMRGLGSSGIAAAALPLARSGFIQNFNNIDAGLYDKAAQMAQTNRQSKLNYFSAHPGDLTPTGIGAGMMGDFLTNNAGSIRDWLSSYGKQKGWFN